MLDYKALPQSEDLATNSLLDDEPVHTKSHYPKYIRVFIYVLLSVNVVLLIANAIASASIHSSLVEVLPVHDPRALAQPDQYVGIPETSRYKTVVLRDENGNLIYPELQRKRSVVSFAGMNRV